MKKLTVDQKGSVLRQIYLAVLTLMILLIVAIMLTRTDEKILSESEEYVSIDQEWSLTPGGDTNVDIKNMGQYFQTGSDTLSIYYTLPEMEYDLDLIYRSKDVFTEMWVDDTKLFETEYYESRFYLKSPGNNWNFVTIPSKYSGQVLELKIRYAYDTDAVSVDHFNLGDKAVWIVNFFKEKARAVLFSLMTIFIGVVIMVINRSSYKRSGKNSLLYLGIYAVLMGMWSLLETNTMQLVSFDGRLIQLLDNLLMITDSLPLFFYLDAEFGIMKKIALRILCMIDIAYIAFCVIGQFTGLIDIHYHLYGSWIATGWSFCILICILVRQVYDWIRSKKIKKRVLIQIIGFVALMLLVILSLPVFINSDGMDRAQSIRIGMLVMVVLFSIAGQLQVYELIQQGSRYEFVKSLAYQDGLTGLHNRTSYLEDFDRFKQKQPDDLGMVFFDVNNLKYANDTFGHEIGDQLICTVADCIDACFEMYGIAYRTGGDEFIVFLECENPQAAYEECLAQFQSELDAINKKKSFPFEVQVAQGFALREEPTEEALQKMAITADSNMYENKKLLKGQK